MTAYYNENNSKTAAWLRGLIADGAVAPGYVDERDIRDVSPADLGGFDQVHLFAGIGTWSYALRQAGWDDDRKIWTASCPCQPFSAAGGRRGFADERHLWPAAHHLIEQRCPDLVVGEQVQSRDGLAWFDLVRDDLEGSGFAVGAINIAASSVGAPHLRQRLYWMGHSARCRLRTFDGFPEEGISPKSQLGGSGLSYDLADATGQRPGSGGDRKAGGGEPTNGYWGNADWLRCRDNGGRNWRPVEPGARPVAYGMPGSMDAIPSELRRLAEVAGLDRQSLARAKGFRTRALSGYGNAIVAPLAASFVQSIMGILIPMMVGIIGLALLMAASQFSQ
jgi:DNA (cytosine-5)-methyltransferase 1